MQEFFLPLTDGVLIPFLKISYSVIPNYGIGIIALTLLIKAIFFPLTKKGIVAMQHTQKLQPKLEELKKKYRDEFENNISDTKIENEVNGKIIDICKKYPIY